MKIASKLSNMNSLVAFLILETLAITAFAIGGVNNVFYIIGILVGLFSLFIAYNRFSRNEALSLGLFMGAMALISILSSFGNLFRSAYGAQNILVVLAINAFLFMGIAARRIKGFKPETLLLTIGSALALLLFISMIYSWIQYGFFYTAIYSGTPIYYYNAELFNVTKEGFWLQGFAFKETLLSSSGLFGILCSCFLGGVFFVKPKENKIYFYLCLAIGLVGLLYLVTAPNIIALLFLIPALFAVVLYKFFGNSKTLSKIIFWVFIIGASLAVLFFIFACVNARGGNALANMIASNGFLNRVFNKNRIMVYINPVLKSIMNNVSYFFFGIDNILANEEVIRTNTKMLEIEILKEGGMIALLLLIGFIVFVFFSLRKYMKNSDDSKGVKIIILCLILSFFIYETFEDNIFPLTHESTLYLSTFRQPIMLVMLFIVGYAYTPLFIKEGESYGKEPVEVEQKETHEVVDKDYEFKDEEVID